MTIKNKITICDKHGHNIVILIVDFVLTFDVQHYQKIYISVKGVMNSGENEPISNRWKRELGGTPSV